MYRTGSEAYYKKCTNAFKNAHKLLSFAIEHNICVCLALIEGGNNQYTDCWI